MSRLLYPQLSITFFMFSHEASVLRITQFSDPLSTDFLYYAGKLSIMFRVIIIYRTSMKFQEIGIFHDDAGEYTHPLHSTHTPMCFLPLYLKTGPSDLIYFPHTFLNLPVVFNLSFHLVKFNKQHCTCSFLCRVPCMRNKEKKSCHSLPTLQHQRQGNKNLQSSNSNQGLLPARH